MVNYSKFFSDVALARKPSPIRVLTAIQAAAGPEMISLAGGQPNPLLFPINAVSFDIGKSNQIEGMVSGGIPYKNHNILQKLESFYTFSESDYQYTTTNGCKGSSIRSIEGDS